MNSTLLRGIVSSSCASTSALRVLSRCSSSNTSEDGVPTHFERRHTTENSFAKENVPFLDHPISREPSNLFWDHKNDSNILDTAENLKAAILNLLIKEKPTISRTSSKGYSKTDPIVFLTKEELDLAQENLVHRYKDILKNDNPLLNERRDIDPKVSKDSGLEWLFESDVTFVDCSESATNQERYIVTRQRDGTLYHNNHEERDSINGSFFPHNFQQFPPADVFECDKTFDHAVSLGTVDMSTLLDMLERSYSLDHPVYHRRHLQLTKMVFDQPELTEQVLFSRHFVPLVMRGLHEKLNESQLVLYLRKTNREETASTIVEFLLSASPLSLKPGKKARPNTIIILNGGQIKIAQTFSKARNTSVKQTLKMKVAKACQIMSEEIVNCSQYEESSILATLRNNDMATQLHNGGKGRVVICEDNEFYIFPEVID